MGTWKGADISQLDDTMEYELMNIVIEIVQ